MGIFAYNFGNGIEFTNEQQLPEEFRNVKKHKLHLESKYHKEKVSSLEEKEKHKKLTWSRNQKTGMLIGRTCYQLFFKGRPFSDYEDLLLLQSQNGLDIGDINHSQKFPASFLPFVAKEVHSRMNRFLSTRLPRTGHLPPLNITADKATYKHRTRQFVAATTVVPDSESLIQVILLGLPPVKGHHGPDIAANWKEVLDSRKIKAKQLEGGTTDGQYFHLGVPACMENLYELPRGAIHWGWDWMHKCGLVDNHLLSEGQFKWTIKVLDVCLEVFKLFNWGQNYEKIIEECIRLRQEYSILAKTCDTRFANSKRYVFINLLKDLKPVISCLEATQIKAIDGNAKDRQKGSEAAALSAKISNAKFLFRLSCLADLYNQYGVIVNIVQTVNLLPHERQEMFDAAVQKMRQMAAAVDSHESCPDDEEQRKICYWPFYHSALQTFEKKSEIHGVAVIDNIEVQGAIGANQTRSTTQQRNKAVDEDVKETVEKQVSVFAKRLADGLEEDVLDQEERKVVAKCKTITDLKSLLIDVKDNGALKVTAARSHLFVKAIRELPVRSLDNVPDEILKAQFSLLLQRLETLQQPCTLAENIDAKKLISLLLKMKEARYEGMEMVMQAVVAASTKFSVESVLESIVSRYEDHFDKTRSVGEEVALNEMEISINGPSIAHCNSVVRAAMNLYWIAKKKSKSWYFVRSSATVDHVQFCVSKVVDRISKKPSKFPFMDI